MIQEEKFDREIKKYFRDELQELPSAQFTEKVMEKLGVQKAGVLAARKPILSGWTKIGILAGYVLLIVVLLYFDKGVAEQSSYLNFLQKIKLPSITGILNTGSEMYLILLTLIGAGWLLIFFDNLLKKVIIR